MNRGGPETEAAWRPQERVHEIKKGGGDIECLFPDLGNKTSRTNPREKCTKGEITDSKKGGGTRTVSVHTLLGHFGAARRPSKAARRMNQNRGQEGR